MAQASDANPPPGSKGADDENHSVDCVVSVLEKPALRERSVQTSGTLSAPDRVARCADEIMAARLATKAAEGATVTQPKPPRPLTAGQRKVLRRQLRRFGSRHQRAGLAKIVKDRK